MKKIPLILFFLQLHLLIGQPFALVNRAIDFSLLDLEGNTFSLSEHLGKDVILLNFWATYCIPCRAEMKDFQELFEKHHKKGFEVVAVSIDEPQTATQIPGFIKQGGYTYTVLKDPEKKVYGLYGGVALPTTLVINRKGEIVKRIQSYFKGEGAVLDSLVEKLLNQPPEDEQVKGATSGSEMLSNLTVSGSNFLRANSGTEKRHSENANWYEDWFDMRIGSSALSYKMRFRSYQYLQDLPESRQNVIRNSNHGVVKQLLKYENKFTDLRAGNIYTNIAQGLAFRTWEDRNARIDKDLQGVKLKLSGSPRVLPGKASLGVLGGKVYGKFTDLNLHDAQPEDRDTHVQGLYGEYSPVKYLTWGYHGMESYKENENAKLMGGYLKVKGAGVNFYTAYVQGKGEDGNNYPGDYTSRAVYSGLTSQIHNFDFSLEYKYYFNYAFSFTDPPNLLKFHTFRLMARNLLFSNNQREEGLQAKMGYKLPQGALTSTNVSYINSSPERNVTFYVHHEDLPFLDVNQDLELPLNDKTKLLLDVNFNDKRFFFDGHFEDQRAYSWGSELERVLGNNYSLQFVFELQHIDLDVIDLVAPRPEESILGSVGDVVETHAYQQSAFYVTLAKIGNWSLTADYELTNYHLEDDSESIHHILPGVSNGWASGYLTYEGFKGHQISLWGGQRKVRVICSGGSCREEPAFEGVELIVTSHF